MRRTDVVVVGAGQAGLAISRVLAVRGIDHVVLERARVGERWLSERWESLRLITPNWMTRLPGRPYPGSDPDGFMPAAEVATLLADYARSFAAPVEAGVAVTRIAAGGAGYRISTGRGDWTARTVVLATGCFDRPLVPDMAGALSPRMRQLVPSRYRNPQSLPDGGVLVVGASATGVQLAEEIHRSGRPVTLAVARHVRLPRSYCGRDIMWWLDRIGVLDERIGDVTDIEAARRQPSLQLAGGRSIDLALLKGRGVRLAGRVIGMDGSRVGFADDLAASAAAADVKLRRILARCDAFADRQCLAAELGPADPPAPVTPGRAPQHLDLDAEGISTVVWATGFRRQYPWLAVDVLDGAGEIVHDGGVTAAPGLYAMGLRFMRRRKSTFIDGAGPDAEEIGAHIAAYLDTSAWKAA
jgi:putative flavoprotein involved in K+ transport